MATTSTREDKEIRYIAFFDLDRTITKAISGRALAREALRRGLLKGSDLAVALYFGMFYRLMLADPVMIMVKMTGWVKGISQETLTDLCQEVFRKVMLPSIHPEVFEELKMHRENNALTVILSSSLVPMCKSVAEYLEMDDIVCSELEVKDGYLTGKPEGNLCYGDEKLVRLKEYCEKNNTTTADAWYYGDAIVDQPALSIVGHPVCVNPDHKLKRVAEKNNWTVYSWK
jgi:putative phosphoserine phosphatase / 1-acylglycerol-3-phosphate O-acyltransferase